MSTSPNQAKTVLDLICDQLSQGWLYYFCAKSLNDAYQKNRITSARFFFMGTYYASLNESILVLSKLLINDTDSISVHYLLNFANNNPSQFPFATSDKIKESIDRNKKKLESYTPLLANIKFQRDNTLAHFDRKHANDPAFILSNPPLDMNEVEKCYRELLLIINDYNKYCSDSEFYLKNIGDDVIEDLSFLLSLIEKADTE